MVFDLIVPSLIAMVTIVMFFLVHPIQRFVFAPAMVVAFIVYLRTSYHEMPPVERVLPIYLIALAVQSLHFTEEYIYDFHERVPEIMNGIPPYTARVFVAFNSIAYAVFLLAALGMYKRVRAAMVIVWFFVIAGVVGNAVWHPLLAAKSGGYFPGLFTSLAYWIVGPVLVKRLLR